MPILPHCAELPLADSEDNDVVLVTGPVKPAAAHDSRAGAAHSPPVVQEPAPKRSKCSKRQPNAVEDIRPISTPAEKQLALELFFPGRERLPPSSALPAKFPHFSKLAMQFNDRVVSASQAQQQGRQVCDICCIACLSSLRPHHYKQHLSHGVAARTTVHA